MSKTKMNRGAGASFLKVSVRGGNGDASPRKAALEKALARKASRAKIRAARKANKEIGRDPAKPAAQAPTEQQNTEPT